MIFILHQNFRSKSKLNQQEVREVNFQAVHFFFSLIFINLEKKLGKNKEIVRTHTNRPYLPVHNKQNTLPVCHRHRNPVDIIARYDNLIDVNISSPSPVASTVVDHALLFPYNNNLSYIHEVPYIPVVTKGRLCLIVVMICRINDNDNGDKAFFKPYQNTIESKFI